MASSEQEKDERHQRRINGSVPKPPAVLVKLRKASPQDEKRLSEAIDLLLTAWVRRRLGEDNVQ